MQIHENDVRCVCTDGYEAQRDVVQLCNDQAGKDNARLIAAAPDLLDALWSIASSALLRGIRCLDR